MKTLDLYKNKKDCCGCELCSLVCPKGIISMQPDNEGFLYPKVINDSICINCKRCVKLCPEKSKIANTNCYNIRNLAGFSKDDNEIRNSSSGGLAYVISRKFIENGGIVYGVRYSKDNYNVEYARGSNIETIDSFRGSKYVQSGKGGGSVYKSVKSDLYSGLNVLVIGLPCEISALKKYLGCDLCNLFTISLICHGPTSPKVHKEFCDRLVMQYKSPILRFSVRYKHIGWKPYFIKAEFEKNIHIEQFNKTDYNTAFLYLKRPSCNSCKFKLFSKNGINSDLLIGDFHLASPGMKPFNKWGSSQVSVLSNKGENLIESISQIFELYPITSKEAFKYNLAILKSFPSRLNRGSFARTFARYGLQKACNLPSVKFINQYNTARMKFMSFIVTGMKKILKNILK